MEESDSGWYHRSDFTGQWWDIPNHLGKKTGLGFVYGIFGHYGNGILLAILYSKPQAIKSRLVRPRVWEWTF